MARVLAALFCAGATLALLTVVLLHSARANVVGLLMIVGSAYGVAGLLRWRAGALSMWVLQGALALGSTLITGVAYFSGDTPSPLVFFSLWVFLYSAYFFTRKAAAGQTVSVGVAYGALLVTAPPASGVPAWWVVDMGTLLVAAILVGVIGCSGCIRGRRRDRIGELVDHPAARLVSLAEATRQRR